MQKLERVHTIKLNNLAIKRRYVQKLLDSLTPEKEITLIIKHSKGFRTVTGTIQTVYGDKFIYKDGRGRLQMVTRNDLMSRDMRVKEE